MQFIYNSCNTQELFHKVQVVDTCMALLLQHIINCRIIVIINNINTIHSANVRYMVWYNIVQCVLIF